MGVLGSGQSSWESQVRILTTTLSRAVPHRKRCTYLSDGIVVAGRLETLVEVALQSFDHVLAIFVALQVAEEDLAVLFVADEFGEA